MSTTSTRVHHTRVTKRYQTDLTDAEWLLIADMLPAAARLGRRREWTMGEIVIAIFYVLRGGITWRLLPKDFRLGRRFTALVARRMCVRADEPRAGHGGAPARRSRGQPLRRLSNPIPPRVQDRDGGAALLPTSRTLIPFICVIWADGGYISERVTMATNVRVDIVNKIANQVGFVVLPRR